MRAAARPRLRSSWSELRAVACVIEGTGFFASVTRSVLSGMSLLAPNHAVPIKFTRSVEDAAAWVARQSRNLSPERLLLADTMVRRQLSARSA